MTLGTDDIASRTAIEQVVNAFYERVRADDILGPIFDNIAHVEWDRHLPRMYDFWETVVFGVARFRGNPLAVHRELASKVPLGAREFGRWLTLFQESVDMLFSGPRSEEAKARASQIAEVMQHHIQATRDSNRGGNDGRRNE